MGIYVVCEECHDKACKDWNIHKLKTLAECSKCHKLTSCVNCEKAFMFYQFPESTTI